MNAPTLNESQLRLVISLIEKDNIERFVKVCNRIVAKSPKNGDELLKELESMLTLTDTMIHEVNALRGLKERYRGQLPTRSS